MLVAAIQANHYSNAKEQIMTALTYAEVIELRLDYFQPLDFEAIATLRREFSLPFIFTLRKKSQGGFYSQDESARLQDIASLCQLQPDYFDLEYDISTAFLQNVQALYPKIKFICSYHNFVETPEDLAAIFQNMQNPYYRVYKMATYARSVVDALRMLVFIKQIQNKYAITGICMGAEGESTRILGPVVGNTFTYANVSKTFMTAPGQLTLQELDTVYHFRRLNLKSKIYALLGHPIDKSVGHIVHNQVMQFLQQNAVYLKLKVLQEDLPQVVQLCRSLPFAGLSITMPLKESIMKHLDKAEDAHAVNTVLINHSRWTGFNTDGLAAVYTLRKKINLSQQKIVILGAGGAAKAIACSLCQEGAAVVILNRTVDKAIQLAQTLKCEGYGLEKINQLKEMNYTVLINTLPIHQQMYTLLQAHQLISRTIAMDIVYRPIHTPFLDIAHEAHCICIPGYEMYIQQALLQIERWFQPTRDQIKMIEMNMASLMAQT